MKRVVHIPVLMDLNEKQFEYLESFSHAKPDPSGTAFVQTYVPFTMGELKEIFGELEKLED